MFLENVHKGPLFGLRQFLTTESPLKIIKNAFYFILKALLILEIFTFLSWLFNLAEKWFDKKAKASFRKCDVTDWTADEYKTHIAQYFKR